MLTCTRLYNLLNDSSTWTSYTRGGSSDSIESEVTICTKIHTFDHLVFGLWHDVAPVDQDASPSLRAPLVEAVATGVLPASAPHGTPAPGAKIDHSCSRCAKYDGREVLKSLFVFDQVPYHPKWGREGFSWNYTYPDGRRTLKICIKPFQGVLGYTSVSDLPSLFINCITVDGKQLKGDLYDLFNRLVNGKEKKTVV
ncbi:hypothetical protein BC829DRAFT_443721 [Chytridium lagenaria]|nr:hypothetical protein BC829DRAFT_443721 [Chytridium lagenaria]